MTPFASRFRLRPLLAVLVALTLASGALGAHAAASSAAAATTTYQAEDASLSGGVVVGSDHTGYTGTGFVGGYTDANKGRAATTFSVNNGTAGAYTASLRYANGTSATMTLTMTVSGGGSRQLTLAATADWNTWTTHTETITLPAGAATIALAFGSADSGNVNLDALALTPAAAPASEQLEAENAVLAGGAVVGSDHTGFTGTGFVGGFTDANKGAAAITFSPSSSGSVSLTLRYANGTGSAHTLSLYVNGQKSGQLSLPATTDWNSWSTHVDTVTLAANSTVSYRYDTSDSGNVNLDNLIVAAATPTPVSVTNPGAQTATVGNAISLQLTAAGGTPPYTFATSGLPAGLSVSSAGVVSGTPTTAGTYPVTVTAKDAAGASAQASFSWTVNAAGSGQTYETETAFFAGGPVTSTATSGYTGAGYLTGFGTVGARTTISVSATAAGAATVTVRYLNTTGTTQTIGVSANDLAVGQLSLSAGSGWLTASQSVVLRAGLNAITYRHASADSAQVSLDNVTVSSGQVLASRGATVPYTEYEAESASTTGTVLAASTTYLDETAEASGRRAVRLSAAGEYVRFTLTQPTNSIVVRYSIPDSADGAGQTAPLSLYANSTKVADLSLTSVYSWVYGAYPYTNVVSQGSPHHFFDEIHAQIGSWPAGTTLTLQRDAADTAAHYDIDLIDTEQVAAATTQPAGYVSATSYGAVANDGADDTSALNSAVAAAKSSNSGLWLPAGTFNVSSRINLGGVSVRGAGEWYTTVRGANGKGGFFATGNDVHIADLLIAGDVRYRDDQNFDTGIEGNFGTGSSVQNVWIEHTKVGMWIDSGTRGLLVTGVRIRDTFADGVNIHADVQDSQFTQSTVRNTGDDGLAMFSEGSPVTRCGFLFDNVQLPMLGNLIGVYGGTSNRVEDDAVYDSVTASAGVAVSTRFSPVPFSGTTSVQRNTLVRTGGYDPYLNTVMPALWIYADTADITSPTVVANLSISNSTNEAVLLSHGGHAITNLSLDHVTIAGAGTYGIQTDSVTGSAALSYVTVSGATSGGLSNPAGYTFVRGAGNSGF